MSRYFKKAQSPPILEAAFHPGKHDVTGLSLSRRFCAAFPHFLTEQQLKDACSHQDPTVKARCGVCSFLVDVALSIGLDVQPDPQPNDLGHVLLPQINYDDFHTNTTAAKQAFIRGSIHQLIAAAANRILIQPG